MRFSLIIYILIMCAAAANARIDSSVKSYSPEQIYRMGLASLNGNNGRQQNKAEGFELIEYAAKKNYAPAINALGLCYLHGNGVTRDPQTALDLFVKALDKGCANAQYNIAQMYNHGWYVDENITRYMVNLREAAAQHDPQALAELGALTLYGDRRALVEQDQPAGVRMLSEAANAGCSDALLNMGYAYRDAMGDLSESPTNAFQFFTEAYNKGNLQGQVEVAKCLIYGFGTNIDFEQGFTLLSLAEVAGNDEASYELGNIYTFGWGQEANDSIAAVYYQRAADSGYAKAMPEMGWIYISGRGVNPDARMAYKYFEAGANAGEGDAYTGMGICHEYAVGTYFDIDKAIAYYHLGSDKGDNYANYCLYNIYREGKYNLGVNQEKALMYLQRACENESSYGNFALGQEYIKGELYEKNESKGISLITSAADEGNVDAAAWLGNEYYSGKGYVKRDFNKAFKYLQNVARQPGVMEDEILAKVYRNLSACYRFGRGTTADESRADYYADKANTLGDPEMSEVVHFRQRSNF